MQASITLHGIDKWQAACKSLLGATEKETKRAFTDIANVVEGEARRLAPVGSEPLNRVKGEGIPRRRGGHLRQSITHAVEQSGSQIMAVVGTNVKYAVFVELGTKSIIGANRAATIQPINIESKGGYSFTKPVLDPQNPLLMWPAQKSRGGIGSKMPFLRTAAVARRAYIEKRLIDIGQKI